MPSVPDGGRRLRLEANETHELRTALFAAFNTRARYRNIVTQDLRRPWREATRGANDNRLFYELRHFAGLPGASDALRTYVEHVEQTIAKVLRLNDNGEPALWSGNFVHADVEPRSGQGTPSPDVPHLSPPPRPRVAWREHASLHLRAAPEALSVRLMGDDGGTVDETEIASSDGYGNAEWADLAAQAHDLIDRHLEHMRQVYEEQNTADQSEPNGIPNATFGHRNPSAQLRQIADMEALAAWLFDKRPPDRTTRERLRHRLRMLGLDTPPAR